VVTPALNTARSGVRVVFPSAEMVSTLLPGATTGAVESAACAATGVAIIASGAKAAAAATERRARFMGAVSCCTLLRDLDEATLRRDEPLQRKPFRLVNRSGTRSHPRSQSTL
jgi:hypothetical protein